MLVDRTLNYNTLPPDRYYKELAKVAIRSAAFATIICLIALFVVGTGLRYSYALEAPKANLPAPYLPETALTRAHYDTLTPTGQQAYNSVERALRNMNGGTSLPEGLTSEELDAVYDAVMADNPDIFWASIQYFSFRNIGPAGVPFISFNYLYGDPSEVEERHELYLSEVKELADGFMQTEHSAHQQAGQAREAYEWLVSHLDYAHTDRDQTVSGALDPDDGYTVCAGYSKTFKMLCDQLGIPCIYVAGTTDSKSDSRHAWNMMVADGYVYYVDATWGDNGSHGSDNWFTMSDGSFTAPNREAFNEQLVQDMKERGYSCEFSDPVSDIMMEEEPRIIDITVSDEEILSELIGGVLERQQRLIDDMVRQQGGVPAWALEIQDALDENIGDANVTVHIPNEGQE